MENQYKNEKKTDSVSNGRGKSEGTRNHYFEPGNKFAEGKGRPRGGDPVSEVGKRIAELRIKSGLTAKQRNQLKKLGMNIDEEGISVLENIMLDWSTSNQAIKQEKFLERTYGKVPNVNINNNQNIDLVQKFKSKFTDEELQAIADGADAMEILFNKIPDVDEE